MQTPSRQALRGKTSIHIYSIPRRAQIINIFDGGKPALPILLKVLSYRQSRDRVLKSTGV